MPTEFVVVLLAALAGILIGGAYSAYKNSSTVAAAVLGVLALLAAGGAVAWFASS
ncbi:hypothetical protein [Actinokineospora bangkokensis]|uniref:hypothetical protein n=1 Tax=Actinokineospora bangkokensis TaxID=1193682 RepID=UPI000A915A63|nr:hypothetical protein [Actinokineospora bangkokensis]